MSHLTECCLTKHGSHGIEILQQPVANENWQHARYLWKPIHQRFLSLGFTISGKGWLVSQNPTNKRTVGLSYTWPCLVHSFIHKMSKSYFVSSFLFCSLYSIVSTTMSLRFRPEQAPVMRLRTSSIPSYFQTIVGRRPPISDDIEEFRGVPYAHVPGRWEHSQLRDRLPRDIFDATQNG
jgi:hypothetical protein